jgi:hypothetical protein
MTDNADVIALNGGQRGTIQNDEWTMDSHPLVTTTIEDTLMQCAAVLDAASDGLAHAGEDGWALIVDSARGALRAQVRGLEVARGADQGGTR